MLGAASLMRKQDSWRHQDSNGVNESFWDAQGVEIGTMAIFADLPKFQMIQILSNVILFSKIGCTG